jgi:hypothetical protein
MFEVWVRVCLDRRTPMNGVDVVFVCIGGLGVQLLDYFCGVCSGALQQGILFVCLCKGLCTVYSMAQVCTRVWRTAPGLAALLRG